MLGGREALEATQDWIDQVNPRFSFEVAQRYTSVKAFTDADAEAAQKAREAVRARVNSVLQEDVVLCLPTAPTPAPSVGQSLSQRQTLRRRIVSLTCIAGTTGTPQINLPLAAVDGLPVSLSLLGARGSDEMLIGFARKIAAAFGE